MKRLSTLLLSGLLAACGTDLPAPTFASIYPSQTAASSPVQLTFKVDAVLPFDLNYNTRNGNIDSAVVVTLGPLRIYQSDWPANGFFSIYLPSVLQPGPYDLSVRLQDGRSASQSAAITVTPGQWPNSYVFDPIDNQLAGVPFQVAVKSVGGSASTFAGNLTLSSSQGNVQPTTTNAFVSGGLLQTVTLKGVSGTVTLTVQDSEGHTGTSNSFQVR